MPINAEVLPQVWIDGVIYNVLTNSTRTATHYAYEGRVYPLHSVIPSEKP